MTVTIKSASVYGIDGFIVDVECYCSGNFPDFSLVGLPDTAVKEAYERIKAAIPLLRNRIPSGGNNRQPRSCRQAQAGNGV